jgi:hypothetical protein
MALASARVTLPIAPFHPRVTLGALATTIVSSATAFAETLTHHHAFFGARADHVVAVAAIVSAVGGAVAAFGRSPLAPTRPAEPAHQPEPPAGEQPMNFAAYFAVLAQILITRTAQFALTLGGRHFSVSVVDKGTNVKPTGFNFSAALLIAAAVTSGSPGVIDVRVGSDVYEITITQLVPSAAVVS